LKTQPPDLKPDTGIDAVIEFGQKTASVIDNHHERMLEVDISPLIVGAAGANVAIADTLIVNRAD
jgi:hypothetical protein